jgi:hypothetical protein
MYQMHLIYEETVFYKYLTHEHTNFYQLNRTKTLLEERFGKFKNLRLLTLAIFALALPLLAIVFTASGMLTLSAWILGFAIFGATVSELIGRYLFFVTVVPLGLAGNFFAGNQR